MQKQIVVVGNPVDGYRFIGDFVSVDAASDFCGGLRNPEWHIAPLESPTEIESLLDLSGGVSAD